MILQMLCSHNGFVLFSILHCMQCSLPLVGDDHSNMASSGFSMLSATPSKLLFTCGTRYFCFSHTNVFTQRFRLHNRNPPMITRSLIYFRCKHLHSADIFQSHSCTLHHKNDSHNNCNDLFFSTICFWCLCTFFFRQVRFHFAKCATIYET